MDMLHKSSGTFSARVCLLKRRSDTERGIRHVRCRESIEEGIRYVRCRESIERGIRYVGCRKSIGWGLNGGPDHIEGETNRQLIEDNNYRQESDSHMPPSKSLVTSLPPIHRMIQVKNVDDTLSRDQHFDSRPDNTFRMEHNVLLYNR